MTGSDERSSVPGGDETLATLIHRADLDGLVRLVDDCCATRDWARLRHVDRVARHRESCRDYIGERRELGNFAVEGDVQDPVVVPVGDKETSAVYFERVLDAGRDAKRRGRWVLDRKCSNVGDHREAVRTVYAVNPDNA